MREAVHITSGSLVCLTFASGRERSVMSGVFINQCFMGFVDIVYIV